MKPEKTLPLMKKILDEATAKGADAIAPPARSAKPTWKCTRTAPTSTYPVVFYSQLMALAFGMDAKKDAALDQNIIKADKLVALGK